MQIGKRIQDTVIPIVKAVPLQGKDIWTYIQNAGYVLQNYAKVSHRSRAQRTYCMRTRVNVGLVLTLLLIYNYS